MENKTFEQQRKEQLALLSKQMTNSIFGITGNNRIFVYPYEANIGKTYTLIDTLKGMQEWQPNTKTLVVTAFKDEGNLIASKIPNAVAVNTDNDDLDEDMLQKFTVVVITHQRYKKLCKNRERRDKYTKGRQNLIIDEELNLTNMAKFDSREITSIETILKEVTTYFNVYTSEEEVHFKAKEELGITYNNIIAGLEKEKNKYIDQKMEFIYYEDAAIDLAIDRLKELLKGVTFTHNYIKHLDYKFGIKVTKDRVLSKLEILKKFYNNPKVIAFSKALYTYDDSIRYFTLYNNILLDASASFHSLYEIADIFEVKNAERIVDHTNWTIHVCEQNSTATHKHHNDKYYDDVIDMVLKYTSKEDKILVLGLDEDNKILRSDYKETIDSLNIDLVNFQAMRGKNLWEDYNKCFIIHNPAMNYVYYAFEYMLYTGKELTDDDLYIQRISKNMGFKNNLVLEKLRKTGIVSNVYQGLKRINRGTKNSNKPADVYIINSDKEISDLIIEQLKNATVIPIPFHSRPKEKKRRNQQGYNNEHRMVKAVGELEKNALLIKEYFEGLSVGEYKKITARNSTKIENRKAFNNALDWLIENDCPLSEIGIEWKEQGKKFEKVEKFI